MRFTIVLLAKLVLAATATSIYSKEPPRPTGHRLRTRVIALSSGDQEVPSVDSTTLARLKLNFDGMFSRASFDLDIFDGTSLKCFWAS